MCFMIYTFPCWKAEITFNQCKSQRFLDIFYQLIRYNVSFNRSNILLLHPWIGQILFLQQNILSDWKLVIRRLDFSFLTYSQCKIMLQSRSVITISKCAGTKADPWRPLFTLGGCLSLGSKSILNFWMIPTTSKNSCDCAVSWPKQCRGPRENDITSGLRIKLLLSSKCLSGENISGDSQEFGSLLTDHWLAITWENTTNMLKRF